MRRSPRLVLVSMLALGALLLSSAAASAQTFPYFGISQSYRDFGLRNGQPGVDVSSSRFWPALHVKTLRVIVPWDLGNRSPSDGRRQEFEQWLGRVAVLEQREHANVDPFVVFGPSELNAQAGKGTLAPTVSSYRQAIQNFLDIWGPTGSSPAPPVRMIGAWNEPNVNNVDMSIPGGVDGPTYLPDGQRVDDPTCPSAATADNCGPRMVAYYWKELRDKIATECVGSGFNPRCYAVAGEFDATPADYAYWNAYANQIDSLINDNYPKQISFHGWRDGAPLNGKGHDCIVDDSGTLSQCSTYTFFKWLENRGGPWGNRSSMKIWNTEAGAKYMSGESNSDPANPGIAQRERVRNLIMASNRYGVSRLYYYNFQYQGGDPEGDSGLIEANGGPSNQRPAWWWIKDHLPKKKTARAAAANSDEDLMGEVGIPESDVDADGFADLVTLFTPGTVVTYPGQPDYQFGPSSSSFAGTMDPALYDGSGHSVIDVEDVNGDLYADLVTLFSNGSACVYAGQTDGTFSPSCASSFAGTMVPGLLKPAGHEPIAVNDVNGDGYGDLVTFFAPTGVIVTYPGQSNGTFADGVQSFAGTMNSARFDGVGHHFIDVADVTGDGRGDLTTMFTESGTAVVYPGQANGSFGSPVQTFAGTFDDGLGDISGHEPIGVADVTGDGRGDLVTFYSPTGVVVVYPGQSGGSFGTAVQSFAGTMDSSLFDGTGHELATVIDVNGDGFGDLVTNYSNGTVHVYPGSPSGAFGGTAALSFAGTFDSSRFDRSGHEFALEKPSIRRLGCATIGCHRSRRDFSGDSKFDVLARKPDGTIWMYRGNGAGGWITGNGEQVGSGASAFDRIIAPGDFTGDGNADLFGRKPDGSLWMVRGNGNGGWSTGNPEWIGSGAGAFDAFLTPGDFTGDGNADLLGRKPDGSLWMVRGNGNGGWSTGNPEWIGNGFHVFSGFVAPAGDFSGDGKPDVLGWKPDGSLWMVRGNGAGGWITGNPEWIGNDWNQFSFVTSVPDFSGDGKIDLLARKPDGSFWMYRGNGAGGWITGNPEWIGNGWQVFDVIRGT